MNTNRLKGTPTAATGTPLAPGGTVSVIPSAGGTSLQAIACKAGMSNSNVGEAVFFYAGGGGEGPGLESTSSSSTSAFMPPGGVDLPPEEGGPEGPGAAPEYDANGNLTHYQEWVYSYDAQNRLRTARNNGTLIATYYYDGKNRQIARRLNDEIRFSVWELIEEYGSNRAVAYLQGATGVIKSWGNNGTFYYYQDKLGSTTHVANASGALLETFHYDLYGKPSEVSAYGIVDLYAGERWIGVLGLYDLRNRFMSPELGRFLQADPIGLKGDASNLYRYCGNDSVNKSDPLGLYAIGKGFTPEQKKELEDAQKIMAEKLGAGANKIDGALKAGEDAKEFKSVKKDFEGVFGKPVTAKDMAGYAERARQMVSGLRDDGKKSYVMVGRDQAYFAKRGLDHHPAAGQRGGKVIFINTDLAFKPEKEIGYPLPWILGHEAAYNQWVEFDVYRSTPEYKTLTPQQALNNADSYVDFAYRQ